MRKEKRTLKLIEQFLVSFLANPILCMAENKSECHKFSSQNETFGHC